MFVHITRGSFSVERYDEIGRLVESKFIPSVKQLPGFRHYYGGADRESGRVIGVSFWETAEQAQAIRALGEPFAALGIQFETVEVYEILTEV